jgi:MFS family permease
MILKPRPRFSGWKMVLLAFLAQNCAMGLAFGSFGPLLASTEQHFQVTRAVAATGMSALMLALGLLAPLAGSALQRVRLRTLLVGGAFISAVAYTGLAVTTSFPVALGMYVLAGAGVCLLGVIAPVTLVARWFESGRAKALSLVNLPILLFLSPYLITEFLPAYGRSAVLLAIGALFLILTPLLWLVVEHPAQLGQLPHGATGQGAAAAAQTDPVAVRLSTGSIFANARFWIISLGVGVMAGAGTAFVVHIISFGVEQHMSLQQASLLLSIHAGSGILGTLLFGWFADRAGPAVALATNTLLQALLWWSLLQVSGTAMFVLAAVMGICVVPVTTLHGASLSALFGAANVSRVMGFSYLIKLPFLFASAPLVGLLFDRTGRYQLPFQLTAMILAVACGAFMLLVYMSRQRALAVPAASNGKKAVPTSPAPNHFTTNG